MTGIRCRTGGANCGCAGRRVIPGYLNRPEETGRALVGGRLAGHPGRAANRTAPIGTWAAPTTWRWWAASRSRRWRWRRCCGRIRAVREVAVAAVGDGQGVGRLRAFVVPVAPLRTGLEDDLIRLTREQLAAFKVPRSVSFVPSLPRTASGKLRRHLVRRGAW
ncbi:Long-chain fatty acid--CoA ligase OS=Streptomyces alboniger OX=132473 GN=CP975_06785 PE=4 SV=1 [Streptomyces alboniger]